MKEMNFAIVGRTKAIHSPNRVRHAVKRCEITYQMISRNVDTDFPGACANEVDSSLPRVVRWLREEAGEDWAFDQVVRSLPRMVPVSVRTGSLALSIDA